MMKTNKTISSLLILFVSFFLFQGNKSSKADAKSLDKSDPFRVTGISPGYQASNVDRNSPIRIRMSQSIDVNSIEGGITVRAMSGEAVEGYITTARDLVEDDTIVFTHSELFEPNTEYEVFFSSLIRSKSGLSLTPYIYHFSTATFNPLGADSDSSSTSGAPKVSAIELLSYPAPGVRYGVYYLTNKPVDKDSLKVRFRYKKGSKVLKTDLMQVRPYFSEGKSTAFALLFPDDGWGAQDATSIEIKTVSASDLDEHSSMVCDKTTRKEFILPIKEVILPK